MSANVGLKFCPECGMMQNPNEHTYNCENCGADMVEAIIGYFDYDDADKLVEAVYGG